MKKKHGPTKRMEQLRDWMNDCKTNIERAFWVDADVVEDGSSSFLLPGMFDQSKGSCTIYGTCPFHVTELELDELISDLAKHYSIQGLYTAHQSPNGIVLYYPSQEPRLVTSYDSLSLGLPSGFVSTLKMQSKLKHWLWLGHVYR